MSKFTSFQALKSKYPTLSSLRVRVHGGLYGKDDPFNHPFNGDNSTPQSSFPTSFSCTNPRIENGCTGTFDIGSYIHHALQNGMASYTPPGVICKVIAQGMTQGCPNMCSIEIQATYQTP